jgi:hypothetical protein
MDDRGFESRYGLGIFFLTTASRPGLGPTQPPIQGVPGGSFPGGKVAGVKLTTHLPLVPMSRRRGAIPPLPNTPSWCGARLKHRDSFTPLHSRRIHCLQYLCLYAAAISDLATVCNFCAITRLMLLNVWCREIYCTLFCVSSGSWSSSSTWR